MLKVTVICVGKLKEKYLTDACSEYAKRLSGYVSLQITEVFDDDALINKIKQKDFVIALDVCGRQMTSEEFSDFIEKSMFTHSSFAFIIGGSDGFSAKVLQRADYRLSFSKMTFPHQLMRVIFLEQLYRAFKIMKGEVYHK